jgi:hypothetical protein
MLGMIVALVGSSRPVRAGEAGDAPGGAPRPDPNRTSILVVYGSLFENNGVTPYADGTAIHLRNPRTNRELVAISGDTDPGRFEAVYLDYQTNDAGMVGDSLVFGLEIPGFVTPTGIVLSAADIVAETVHVNLAVHPPIPVGACCHADGACEVIQWFDCLSDDGELYMGTGTTCDPGLCNLVGGGEVAASGLPFVQGTPNPFCDRVALRIAGPNGSPTRVTIFDAAGRQVRSLWQGSLSEQAATIWWDGRDQSGRVVPVGLYMVRVSGGHGDGVERLVKTQ